MEYTLQSQIFNFFVSLICGIIFSIIFDIFIILELILNKKNHNFRDFTYFIVIGFMSYLITLAINNGNVSFHILFAQLLGWCIWHKTLSKKIIKIAKKLILKIKLPMLTFFKKWVKKPLKHFNEKIKNTIYKLKKFKKNFRKTNSKIDL